MKREDVYKLIDGEREYQDGLWTPEITSSGGNHSPEEWILYMQQYLNEAQKILSHEAVQTAYPKAMEAIRKVTAMGVAAMEQHNTLPRKHILIHKA